MTTEQIEEMRAELEQFYARIVRVDMLMCLLFEGLLNHPLASTMIPPDQLEMIQAVLHAEAKSG